MILIEEGKLLPQGRAPVSFNELAASLQFAAPCHRHVDRIALA